MTSIPSSLYDFLLAHHTLTLATVDDSGHPHAAALFYAVAEDLRLVFLSDPHTYHARHIGQGAWVALTIQDDGQSWQAITGVQIHGFARPGGSDARAIYQARFPFIARAEILAQAVKQARVYEILPTWARLIDNRLGFGHKQEWRFQITL